MAKTGFNGFPQPRPDRGGTNTGDANASAEDILVTKSGYVRGVKVNGTMLNHGGGSYQGAASPLTAASGVIPLVPPQGYWDGVSWCDISDPNFIAANIRTDKPMFGLAGTMPARTSDNVGSSPNGFSVAGRLYIRVANGWWDGSASTYVDDPNWLAANIRGTIFGLAGTAKRSASGTLTQGTAGNIVVAGLSFTPTKVIISTKNTTQTSHDTVILSSTADLYDMGTFAGAKSQWMYGVIQSGVNNTNGSTQGTINADGFTSTRGAGVGSLVSWWAFE